MQLKKAADIATALNLLIIFLGIFGVVSLTLIKRTKEIAVRKVLGADVGNIILLFAKDYTWLILIANIIACPVAYFITNTISSVLLASEVSVFTLLLSSCCVANTFLSESIFNDSLCAKAIAPVIIIKQPMEYIFVSSLFMITKLVFE